MLQNITSWATLTQHKILHDFGAFPASGPKLLHPGILWSTDIKPKKVLMQTTDDNSAKAQVGSLLGVPK